MASPRAQWKGYLKVAEIVCPVALFSGATTSERTSFRTVNRDTGNGVRRIYVDAKTHKEVEREDQVKGYETDKDQFVILEPNEIAAAVPESDKTLDVKAFIPCREVDTVYFEKPYYLRPDGKAAEETYRVLIEGMKATNVAALAQGVLFRRVRTLIVRPFEGGIVANTLPATSWRRKPARSTRANSTIAMTRQLPNWSRRSSPASRSRSGRRSRRRRWST
jgi:DNA end-binding protein Ku